MDGPIFHLEGVLKAKSDGPEDFIGPLDLILHLLGKNKMEIRDISLTLILEQYLEWIGRRQELDLEVASEFITMASHLIYIKSRMLLSVHDEEALSEMEQLIATLEAHQRQESYGKIKAVVPELEARYAVGREYCTKPPEPVRVKSGYRYLHDRQDLIRTVRLVLSRTEGKLPPPISAFQGIVGREPYSVADKAGQILQQLLKSGVSRFRALFRGNRSRSEIVATFIAVLELCRARKIRLAGTAEDCTVTGTGTAADAPVDFSTGLD